MTFRATTAVLAACLAASAAGAQQAHDCLMDPAEIVSVGTTATGILETMSVRRGDKVRKGDQIGRLESTLEESSIDILRTRAASTRLIDTQKKQVAMYDRRLERARALRERAVVTEEALEMIEAERLAAESLLVQAEINREIAELEAARAEIVLRQRVIRSPLDGVVIELGRFAGEYVDTRDHVAKVARLDPLHVEVFLPVSLFGTVRIGDTAQVQPAAPVGGVHDARVISVDPVFDAASGTFGLQLELSNPDLALPGGHRCTVVFPEN
ncbi:efflux RND transporter periplasmic adaptor subunit [Pseudotabrizicola algicola]|uniref:Efflux RND transporter periplasmic adaptor subunit n=1 Tax=Pseudotabrizicola algicola TaxID=2709381 RepID=A0A6B3RMX5_9RHOB|nr:efflux RND transporter periplasmic adaptor subunit [Pseudotabrizicola algicola]NEX46556.1 efflux RND transporter periplasmic adaptor subunit [Pseudotabrizicola algicola]